MDLRTCIAAVALVANISVVLGQSTENQKNLSSNSSSSWTYDSKTNQLSGDATSTKRQAAKEIVDLELSEYRSWNNHNIQGVLAVYWNSPDLVSIAGDEPEVHGFAALQTALTTVYADPNTMGRIDLDRLKVQVISDTSATCVASYVVHTSTSVYYCDDTGTLQRFSDGWKIVFERATIHQN